MKELGLEISPEAKQKYLERRRSSVVVLEHAIEHHEEEVLKTIGHQLKGNARVFGFDDLEPIARELEHAAIEQDWIAAARMVEMFREWVGRQGSA